MVTEGPNEKASSSEPDFEAAFKCSDAVRALQERGAWAEACEMCAECVRRFPENPERRWWLAMYGDALLELKRFKAAADVFRALRETFPEEARGYSGFARTLQQQQLWDEAAQAWDQCLARFPGHSDRPWWLAMYGDALLEGGHEMKASEVFCMLKLHCPNETQGFSGLARVSQAKGHWDEAVEFWIDCLNRFPQHPGRRWWLAMYGYALIEQEQIEAARNVFRLLQDEFPDEPYGYAGQASLAERYWKWETAISFWDVALSKCTEADQPSFLASKARCLLEIGACQEATELLSQQIGAGTTHIDVLVQWAELATLQGPVAESELRWNMCVTLHPSKPAGLIGKARHLRTVCNADDEESLLAEAQERCPNNPTFARMAAELAAEQRNFALAQDRWDRALRFFPRSKEILFGYFEFLGAIGAISQGDLLLLERCGTASLRHHCMFHFAKGNRDLDRAVQHLAELVSTDPPDTALLLHEAEIRSWRLGSDDLNRAQSILEQLLQSSPGSVRIKAQLVRVLILQGDAPRASALIDTISDRDNRRDVLQCRIWKDHLLKRQAETEARWHELSRRFFLPALNCPAGDLRCVSQKLRFAQSGDILLMSIVRNEEPRLSSFLDYYRKIGVTGFVLVDNGSSDGTTDYLCRQPDVALYHTAGSFSASSCGMRWLNQLIDMHGDHSWVIYADADERLVFPLSEERGLGALTRYLSLKGHQVVAATMLDMFPQFANSESPGLERDIAESYLWFDPPCIHQAMICPYIEVSGGVRKRLFGTTVTLNKAPIVWGGANIRYLNNHTTSPGIVSYVTAALLHYHLDSLFEAGNVERLRQEVGRGQYPDYAVDRRRSLERLERIAAFDLRGPESLKYTGNQLLLRIGLMKSTPEFDG